MFAVVNNGKFNGVVYAALTLAIIAHHEKFDEVFARVEKAPQPTENQAGNMEYSVPTDEQLSAGASAVNKLKKETEISSITVSVDGMTFDGNENSQALMERNAATMNAEGLETIPWKLADNSFSDVTAAQLNEAVMLAAAQQRDIVVKYG